MAWRGSSTATDRLFASLPYLLPLVAGMWFGGFLFRQFPALEVLKLPLYPVIVLYSTIPYADLVLFFILLMAVVRNYKLPHFIRFNTMQALLLDIALVLIQLLFGLFPPLKDLGFVSETFFNTVFLAALASCGFAVVQTVRGLYAEIPVIADAAYTQVPQ